MTCRSGCACLMYPFAVYRTHCFAHEHVAVWEVLYHAISAMYVTTLQTTNTTVVSEPFGCIMIHNTAYTTVGPQLCSCLFVLSMWISEDSTCIFVRGKGLHGAVALTILRSGVRVRASQEKGYRYPRCLENGFICSMGYRSDQLGNTVSARRTMSRLDFRSWTQTLNSVCFFVAPWHASLSVIRAMKAYFVAEMGPKMVGAATP